MSEPDWRPFRALPRAHGQPLATGRLRATPDDFQVEERLGFAPDGEGQHWLLRVRKVNANTEWVARQLAAHAGVPGAAVGFAGLKDRHAIAWQWFSVPAQHQSEADWLAVASDEFQVIAAQRHRRKLRRGALAGNAFRIRVSGLSVHPEGLAERLARILAEGVPNYFGEQRFGIAARNLTAATAYFAGRSGAGGRHRRGLLLSAVRAQLFNEVLALRVLRGDWASPLPGERLQLAGSRSHFLAEQIDQVLTERARSGDILPTGPLWGCGAQLTAAEVARLETHVIESFPVWTQGLEAAGLRQERRPLRLQVAGLVAARPQSEVLEVAFELGSGGYATAVLRELVDWSA